MSTFTRILRKMFQTVFAAPKPELVSSPQELAVLMAEGHRCYADWLQDHSEFKTSAGLIVDCRDDCILVDHWSKRWYRFDDPSFRVVVIRHVEVEHG